MPIGFSPDDYIDISLNCVDVGKPDAERAKFRIRFITSGETKRIEKIREDAWMKAASGNHAEADGLLNQAIRIGIIGWKNLIGNDGKEINFAPPADPDVLDEFPMRLKFAIVATYPWVLVLTDNEKKASPSPLPADTAGSAQVAQAENVVIGQT